MADSLLKTIQTNVKNRRVSLGFSQEALAERAGLHRTYVGGVERGERNVTVLSLEKIATALGCSVADLLRES